VSDDVAGDGSSSYLWAFDPWQKVAGNDAENAPKLIPADFIYKLTPFAKLVFVLRNPTNRSPDCLPLCWFCRFGCQRVWCCMGV